MITIVCLCSEESRTSTASTMELIVTIAKSWKLLLTVTKSSILDVITVLDPLLIADFFTLHIFLFIMYVFSLASIEKQSM